MRRSSAQAETSAGTSARAPVSVLIVDDNEDAALSLTMLLELEKISSAVARDASTALQMLESLRPVLMLIDIGLPGMDGVELAQRLRRREDTRSTTLIALTGRDAETHEDRAPFDQFWTKPFNPGKLVDEVKTLISAASVCVCATSPARSPVRS